MSLIDYFCDIIGISFEELGSLSLSQTVILICCCIVCVFTLLFIIRGVLGGVMYLFR